MLTKQDKSAFKRDVFSIIKKLACKTTSIPINKWVEIRPTKYGWRNAYRYGVVENDLSMSIDRNWQGGCYSTGGVDGGIYYLFTGYAIAFIIDVPRYENPIKIVKSIYDDVDLELFFTDSCVNDNEIREYLQSAILIVDDILKNKSSIINKVDIDDEFFSCKQKLLCDILASYFYPKYGFLSERYNPTDNVVKTGCYLENTSIYMIDIIIKNLVSQEQFFPFIQDSTFFSKINLFKQHCTIN